MTCAISVLPIGLWLKAQVCSVRNTCMDDAWTLAAEQFILLLSGQRAGLIWLGLPSGSWTGTIPWNLTWLVTFGNFCSLGCLRLLGGHSRPIGLCYWGWLTGFFL